MTTNIINILEKKYTQIFDVKGNVAVVSGQNCHTVKPELDLCLAALSEGLSADWGEPMKQGEGWGQRQEARTGHGLNPELVEDHLGIFLLYNLSSHRLHNQLGSHCRGKRRQTPTSAFMWTKLRKWGNVLKILLSANVWARKAALVRNYFSRRNNFHLSCSWLPSLSLAQQLLTI